MWMSYAVEFAYYLGYALYLAGIAAAIGGFRRSRKAGYLLLAIYLLMPFIGLIFTAFANMDPEYRALREEVEAAHARMLAESAPGNAAPGSGDVAVTKTVRVQETPDGPLILFLATLLLAWREKPLNRDERVSGPHA